MKANSNKVYPVKVNLAPKDITSIGDLEKYSAGQIVELPPFAEGQPFVARIRRPSMLALIKGGKVPNSLLKTASSLFNGEFNQNSKEDEEAMSKLFQVLDVIADACLIEPSLDEIHKAGIQLSDDQYMYIFNYTQRGVKALESFREVSANNRTNIDVENLQSETK
jgi:hypothetical protein